MKGKVGKNTKVCMFLKPKKKKKKKANIFESWSRTLISAGMLKVLPGMPVQSGIWDDMEQGGHLYEKFQKFLARTE